MNARIFKSLWGHEGSLRDAAAQAVAAAFGGLEGPVPKTPGERAALVELLGETGLDFIAEISTTGFAAPDPGADVGAQIEAFRSLLDASLEVSPRLCTAMAGSDLWSFAESVDFLTRAWEIAQDRGARVGFETHRSRSLYHPVRTVELLAELPPIELTLDFSHWCVVTERLVLDERPDILARCAERAAHMHLRVGYDQGPQVPDPRAPEYTPALDAHLRWWRAVWATQERRGCELVTMTPEFGPDGYLHCAPFTGEPVADLWELNRWIAARALSEFPQPEIATAV